MNEELQAGPALDRRIATEVLGWMMYHYDKDVEANCYWMLLDRDLQSVEGATPYRKNEHKSEEAAWAACPPFSTNIVAAWQLVAHMEGEGYGIMLLWGKGHQQPGWSVVFNRLSPAGYNLGSENAPTAPLAICRAALAAVTSLP